MQVLRKIVACKKKKLKWSKMTNNLISLENTDNAFKNIAMESIENELTSLYDQFKEKVKTKYTKLSKKCKEVSVIYKEFPWKDFMSFNDASFEKITMISIPKDDLQKLLKVGINCINVYDYVSKILDEPVTSSINEIPDIKRLLNEVYPFGVLFKEENFENAKDISFIFVKEKLAHLSYADDIYSLSETSIKEASFTKEFFINSNKQIIEKIQNTIEKNDNDKIYDTLTYSKEDTTNYSTREKRLYIIWSFLSLGYTFLEFVLNLLVNNLNTIKNVIEKHEPVIDTSNDTDTDTDTDNEEEI